MHVCGRVHTVLRHNVPPLVPAKSALDVHLLYLPAPLRIQIGRFGEVPDQLALNLLQGTAHMTEVDSQSKRREIARVAVLYGAVILHVAAHWIAVGAIVLLGLAILKGVQATRGKDPS